MAYQFPLNGGRINASIGGNSTSNGAGYSLISTGTMLLAGGNNITLSQNGSAITISGANAPSGSINFSAGTTSNNLAAITFASSNGVGFGLNGSVMTATVATNYAASNHSHGNPTLALTNLSGTTASASNGLTLSLNAPSQSNLYATGALSISNNGNSISIGAPAFSAGISGGNTSGTSGTASNQVVFAGGNNVTLSQATGAGGNTISISAANQTAYSLSGNGITFNTNGSTVSASVATNYAASNHSHGNPTLALTNLSGTTASASNGLTLSLSAAAGGGGAAFSAGISGGNTSGTSGAATNQIMFAGGNNVTLSQVTGAGGNTVTISGAPMFDAGVSAAAGGTTYGTMATSMTGGLMLYAGNNIGLSQATDSNNNALVTIQAAGGGGGGGGIALGNSQTTYTSGTANLLAGGALSINSTTGQGMMFSAPGQSTISATGALSISNTGNTILIGAPSIAGATLSRWEYPQQAYTTMANGTAAQSSLSLQHVYIPFNLTAASAKIGGSLTVATFTSATTATASYSLHMGVYSLNGSSLALINSGSANNSFSWANTANAQYTQTVVGLRQMTVPMNLNLSAGEYWVGALLMSSTNYTGSSNAFTMLANSQIHATGVLGVIGSSTSAGRDILLGQGIYSTTVSALPSNIPLVNINNVSGSYVQRAAFYHALYNATY